DARVALGDRLEPDAELELDAALAERALELLADRLVFVRNEVGERLDDGDLGAPRAPHARELDADDTAAEHGDLLGHEVEGECTLGGDDAAAELEARKRARVGAGGENNVLAGDALPIDLDGVGRDELALTGDHGDAARFDESAEALELARHDLFAVLRDRGDVDAAKCRGDPVVGGVT